MSTKTGKINVPEMLTPIDPEKTKDLSDQFAALLAENDLPELPPDFAQFLGNVFGLSPFLRDCAFKEATFLHEAWSNGFEASIVETIENCEKTGCSITDEAEFMREIRIAKRRVALLVGLADLSRLWNGEKVTGYLSQFASASLSACLDFLLTRYHADEKLVLPDPDNPQHECGLIVLGMGKLGAGELNYSSDVDLILLYDNAAKIELLTDDPITVWGRFAKQLIRLMQERTGDGYVFRMDLRLRPDPSSTPLVVPYEAAQLYYEGQGQNWERAAMIKARPVAGDMKAGQSFLAEIKPFIWHKYLDFAAIHDVQSIKRQIHAHKGHGQIAVEGHNIKLGRG
ncbi:MAG: bifunctional [glutamine synthetase] adenylyltransferase/[glutamine synthetase]-adenylyl-L-tyrosine phosphorylase, partial [Pseudomonadota bacterium]